MYGYIERVRKNALTKHTENETLYLSNAET